MTHQRLKYETFLQFKREIIQLRILGIYSVPENNKPLTLFEYSVRKVISLNKMGETHSHQAWANLIFDYENKGYVKSDLMSIVKREYSQYFSEDFQYTFLEDKIRANFPYLFGKAKKLGLFERMLDALEAECIEQRSPRNRKSYRVSTCDNISSQEDNYIYRATLLVEEGDDPHFSEGMPFEFKNPDTTYVCEVIEYDYANAILFFSSKRKVYVTHDSKVVSDATMNTIALKNLLEQISTEKIEETLPIHKFLNGTTKDLSKVTHADYPTYLNELLSADASQFEAFQAALNNDITFIWGPPGTGKSYTLAAIIMALHQMPDERTAVCCLSNVAVDQLVNKVVDIIEVHEPNMTKGEFYRAGRTQDEKLINTDFLYPDDQESFILRMKIRMYCDKIDKFRKNNLQYSDQAIKTKAKLKDAREALKEHTDYLINQVKVVFSTIANFVLNSRLKDATFDNLIVDEASMLAEPQLIALARNVRKRIILVGDFQQLSPITVAGVPVLRDSVFKLCGIDIDHTDHPALHQLLNQRRSNPKLVDIINHSFYEDKLVAKNNKNNPVVARAPFSGCVIGMISVANGVVRFTKGGTRQNVADADAVMELLDMYFQQEEETFSIGVITPYRGQVSLLKAKFISRNYSVDFQDRVKIGTVHTFQGSECDVIIFDMVDCSRFEKGKKPYFGRIYGGENGEQLMNVAVSRARHKLIVVCDPDYITKSPGGVISYKTQLIFNSLLRARNTRP